jgi:hypothetical protein
LDASLSVCRAAVRDVAEEQKAQQAAAQVSRWRRPVRRAADRAD